jgi:hypothetical protein
MCSIVVSKRGVSTPWMYWLQERMDL